MESIEALAAMVGAGPLYIRPKLELPHSTHTKLSSLSSAPSKGELASVNM